MWKVAVHSGHQPSMMQSSTSGDHDSPSLYRRHATVVRTVSASLCGYKLNCSNQVATVKQPSRMKDCSASQLFACNNAIADDLL